MNKFFEGDVCEVTDGYYAGEHVLILGLSTEKSPTTYKVKILFGELRGRTPTIPEYYLEECSDED